MPIQNFWALLTLWIRVARENEVNYNKDLGALYCGLLLCIAELPGCGSDKLFEPLGKLTLVAETGPQGDLHDWSTFRQEVPCFPNAALGQVGVGWQPDLCFEHSQQMKGTDVDGLCNLFEGEIVLVMLLYKLLCYSNVVSVGCVLNHKRPRRPVADQQMRHRLDQPGFFFHCRCFGFFYCRMQGMQQIRGVVVLNVLFSEI